jgi:hypothetical protein
VPAATDGDVLAGAELDAGGELSDDEAGELIGADDAGPALDRAFVQAALASSETTTAPRAMARKEPRERSARA